MVGVLYTEGYVILSLTAGPLSVSYSNGKIPTLFLYTSKRVSEQNVASHGISLLSVAGKLLAKMMLARLLEHVVDLVLPVSLRVPTRTQHNWHDICCPATAGIML